MPPLTQAKDEPKGKRSLTPYISGLVALVCYLTFLGLATFSWKGGWINDLFRDHYLFFVGLPFAGLLAHFLVGTLENTRGQIEFEVLGMKFKGASGPIVMWVLVFLAIVVAIRLVWTLN